MVMSKKKKAAKYIGIYGTLIIAFICTAFPVYWMVKSSITPNAEMNVPHPSLLPSTITFEHYVTLFSQKNFLQNLLNSLYVAGITTVICLAISIVGSYAMTRLRFPLRRMFKQSVILSYLLPTAVLFIPMYSMASSLGFFDNKNGLLLIYPTFVVPYCCYMLISYFQSVPYALEEAALIDGCTRLKTMVRIIIPIAAPGIAVVATFAFTQAWNEYLYALVMTTSDLQKTVTVAISGFKYADTAIWGLIMSASVIASLPVVIIYVIAQSMLISGKADGSVK